MLEGVFPRDDIMLGWQSSIAWLGPIPFHFGFY